MPQKRKHSLVEQNKQKPGAEHKLETGDYQDRTACSGVARPIVCPSPCNPSLSGAPAVETGDSLEISWKTFLSVLRSMEECSANKMSALAPQLITSQPVLLRKKIAIKPEKIRKGRSSALPVILKPGEKPNATLQKEREPSAVVHSSKQDADKIRTGSDQLDSCRKTPKGDVSHSASKTKGDQSSSETNYTQLPLSLPEPKSAVQRQREVPPLILQENTSLTHKFKKGNLGLTNHKDWHQQSSQAESQLPSQESNRVGSNKVFRQKLSSCVSALPHLECQTRSNLVASAVKSQPQDGTLPQIATKNLQNTLHQLSSVVLSVLNRLQSGLNSALSVLS
ncbi:uncharacterized protein LOC132582276 [Heteronotia binoei]|uniref:uncharacterized protein LOC132582276 n=1 Tax=Heteronotia binoei TaxID=13085 RepID=UPI0029308F60|nr:uncharacterized protein LOC132582276 [Heteronotia binoei]